jgi:hypothetical protein
MANDVYTGFWIDWGKEWSYDNRSASLTTNREGSIEGRHFNFATGTRLRPCIIPYTVRTVLRCLLLARSLLHTAPRPLDDDSARWPIPATPNHPPQCDYGTECAVELGSLYVGVERQSRIAFSPRHCAPPDHHRTYVFLRRSRSVLIADCIHRRGFSTRPIGRLWLSERDIQHPRTRGVQP